jgi:dipeptidyl aminopeptidase/acylaminoacyl peptidase
MLSFRRIFYTIAVPAILLSLTQATPSYAQTKPHLTLEDILPPEGIGETALSPDGKTIAFTRNEQLVLLPAKGGWPVTLTSTLGGKSRVAWSPDGNSLAYVSQGGIWVVPVAGGAPRRITNAPPGAGDPRQATDRAPQWSPKGRWILFQSGRRGYNSLLVVSADGESTNFLTAPHDEAGEGRWSPNCDAIIDVSRSKDYFSGRLNLIHFEPSSGQRINERKLPRRLSQLRKGAPGSRELTWVSKPGEAPPNSFLWATHSHPYGRTAVVHPEPNQSEATCSSAAPTTYVRTETPLSASYPERL